MTKRRKHYSADQNIAILRRHLLEHVAVSDLRDEYGIQPSVLYRWQQQLFEYDAARPVAQGCRGSPIPRYSRLGRRS